MASSLRLSCFRCSPDIPSASRPFFFHIAATDNPLLSRRRRRPSSITSIPIDRLQENDSCSSSSGGTAAAALDQQTDGLPYTSMKEDPLRFWETHQPLRKGPWIESDAAAENGKKSERRQIDEEAAAEEMRLAELRLLAVAAADRAEMHAILSTQRDNWNKLFQDAVRCGCATSCILAATGAAAGGSAAPSAPAALLCLCTAAIMAVVNYFQPSQLAEEQRTAARLFRSLVSDIESFALRVSPRLRPPSAVLLRDARRRLAALDVAFPMPLTPGGLEKFPDPLLPTVLRTRLDNSPDATTAAATPASRRRRRRRPSDDELLRVADLLRAADIPKYIGWAKNLVRANKVLAVAAPALALAAAGVNAAVAGGAAGAAAQSAAAVLCVLAMVGSSVSHDLQMGMVVEMYRNSAGYYADMEEEIRDTLTAAAAATEEEAELLRQKVAYKLGRCPTAAKLVGDGEAMAGTLF